MVGVREQAKATEEMNYSTIENMISTVIALLRDREVALISDVEAVKYQKEKEPQLQKDELEFLLSGIRHAVLFSEAMMKEGSETEIVAGHQQVVTRMSTLTKEREKAQLEPVSDEIVFVGGKKKGLAAMSSVIKDLGTVVNTSISAEQSTIEKSRVVSHLVNQPSSFKVTLVDKTGKKAAMEMLSKAVKRIVVEVMGPSKVKVCATLIHSSYVWFCCV